MKPPSSASRREPTRVRWLVVGEATIHTTRLCDALSDLDIDVHLATFGHAETKARLHALGSSTAGHRRFARGVGRLRTIIRDARPDVVQANYLSSYGLMAALTTRAGLVQTAWGTDILITAQRQPWRALAAFALRRAKLATADSRSVLDGIEQLAPRTPVHQFVFGPPASLFDTSYPKTDIVLSPRNHETHYRIDLILEAWDLARPRMPGYRLIVAGSGSQTDRLRSLASADDTEFTGQLPYQQLLELMGASRVVVSVPTTDATSASVLEAMALGCAMVASDLAANREWIPAEHLVPFHTTPQELADAIVASRDSPLSLARTWAFEEQVASLVRRVLDTVKLSTDG